MSVVIERAPVTEAVMARLRTLRPTEYCRLPEEAAGGAGALPVFTLWPVADDESRTPDMGDPARSVTLEYQVSVVAGSGDQAELWLDRIKVLFFARQGDGRWATPLALPDGYVEGERRRGAWGLQVGDGQGGIVSLAGRFAVDVTT